MHTLNRRYHIFLTSEDQRERERERETKKITKKEQ